MALKNIFLEIVVLAIAGRALADWTAIPDDPNVYASLFPECGKVVQRPVNLNTSSAIYYRGLAPVNFYNYDLNLYFNFSNNGYTVVATQTKDLNARPFIGGADFGSTILVLQQFHFHWGPDVNSGSDHLINGKAYPLELHLVHQASNGYVGVIAFQFEISGPDNPNLDQLLKIVGMDIGPEGNIRGNLTLGRIFPNTESLNKNGYYRYVGSTSTPPCSDIILWHIYKDRIPISANQILFFYKNIIKYNLKPPTTLTTKPLFVSAA